MRVFSTGLSLCVLSLCSLASGLVVEFNKNMMSSTPDNRITFATTEMRPVRHNLLGSPDDYTLDNSRITCNVTDDKIESGTVTVLLAISKCLNTSSIEMIESWVDKIKDEKMTYFKDGGDVTIEFSTTVIPGECEARSEANKKGLKDEFVDSWDEKNLLSQEENGWIGAFERFGRVLDALPTDADDIPIAVISFVNNKDSYDQITQYEEMTKVTNTFNFQLCKTGESCTGHFENCLLLQEDVDLFMYNPFTIVRSFHCSMLQDGIPVTYLDEDGVRQCFCACPAGYEQHTDNYNNHYCAQVEPDQCQCTWSVHQAYKFENDQPLDTCSFTNILSNWGVPAPFPSDNYVADYRTNDHDASEDQLQNGPHIDLSLTPQYKTVYDYQTLAQLLEEHGMNVDEYTSDGVPDTNFDIATLDGTPVFTPPKELGDSEINTFTWQDYQVHREAIIDDLMFTSYGRYLLEVDANDYSNNAQCRGCLAIVDQYRPTHTSQCPASFCDNTTSLCQGYETSTAEMNPENLEKTNLLVSQVYDFQANATNDACSIDNRCDYEDFQLKDFFQDEYCSERTYHDYGPMCFHQDKIEEELFKDGSVMFENPLVNGNDVNQNEIVLQEGQCTRCCSYTTQLRETWVDYTCNQDVDLQRCEGKTTEECSFKQCMVLFGNTVATAGARIKQEIVDESNRVIENLSQKGFQSHTQIHRALDCSSFGDTEQTCSYEATLSDLIETHVGKTFLNAEPDEYVFWRYAIGEHDGTPHTWMLVGQDEPVYTFDQTETKIIVEAWTQCGRVRKFYFYVHLHLNSDIHVCDKFSEMWYQTSVSHMSLASDAELCAYPGGDFAEVTFDYHPNVGLQYARDQLRMNISEVACWMSIDGRDAAQVLDLDGESREIVQRYAIELANNPQTHEITNVHVKCNFTYTLYDETTLTHSCDRDFIIKDCTGPTIDLPQAECEFDDCAGRDLPGPYESCGGKVVRSTEDRTYMDEDDVECCNSCGYETTCEAVLGLPNVDDDIKWCVPQIPEGIYGYQTDNNDYPHKDYQTNEPPRPIIAMAKNAVANNAGMAAVLGASAMVAVVALLVVRRQRRVAEKAVVDDAYYPLLH